MDQVSDKAKLMKKKEPVAVVSRDVSDLSPAQAISTLQSELMFMTRLKDKFIKNLNDTRKQLVYTEEEAKEAVARRRDIEKQLDEFYLELSDL
jgi:hypothetical protein